MWDYTLSILVLNDKGNTQMANIIYLKLQGNKQGLISRGCSTMDSIGNKFQNGHEDEILIHELSSNLSMDQNVSFQPIDIRKSIDKASPLLSQSLTSNEILTCDFSFYRTSMSGGLELYYKIKLTEASIVNIHCFYPNSITQIKRSQKNHYLFDLNLLLGNMSKRELAHTVYGMRGFFKCFLVQKKRLNGTQMN
ncbi:type VI secretion system Hcp family effector [Providencia alcalifaciens]|nr:type VI secretion system Hcp family effector [Providencia alcalifaciens]